MELRSKVAADSAALIPFHCIICFDEFNLQDRPPMVLPCGHTFVCLPCTKRIRKCMECREPLYLNPNANQQVPPNRRYGTHPNTSPQAPSTPPYPPTTNSVHPPTLLPLPIPKNVVLIAMMEAAERQSRRMKEEKNLPHKDDDDEEQLDPKHILHGITTLSGSCGTYVVKEPLTVISCDPRDSENDSRKEDCMALMKGQKCQIVDFEHGVARLARNRGYVKASTAQLVKVGTPVDEACRIEGLLQTVQKKSIDLQREIEVNRRMENELQRQLEAALDATETTPIITEKPDDWLHGSVVCDSGSLTHPTTPAQFSMQTVLQTPESSSSAIYDCRGVQAKKTECNSASHSSPSMSIDSSDVRSEYRSDGEFVLGCGTTLLGNTGHLFYYSGSEDDENMDHNHIRRSGSEMERNHPSLRTPTQTSSFDGIDFRTGLSGHRALSIAKTGQYTPRVRMRLMMSQHRGITNSRPNRGPPPPPSLSFTDSPL